jgi:hypothetical protein
LERRQRISSGMKGRPVPPFLMHGFAIPSSCRQGAKTGKPGYFAYRPTGVHALFPDPYVAAG